MSRSNPALINPSKHFFEWKGGEGKLEFYDKDKQERINVPLPFEFLVLDQLATITGYSKTSKSSYYSNEVRNSNKEEFTVKLKSQTVFTGLYKNDQGIAQVPKGAGYAKSIYIAHKTKTGEYIMGNIKAASSALGAWIEFSNKFKPENGKVIMTKGPIQESPVGQFYAPEFEYKSSDSDEDEIAIALDKELQIYLSHYLFTPKEDSSSWPSNQVDLGKATPEQIEDFENRKATKQTIEDEPMPPTHHNQKLDVVIEDIGENEEINIDDIPF